ncbi:MAG: hypothetical protein Q8O60_08600, partial [Deltaproteobacteria bacterium]|nr:hypothetical protein [Deltaproteobacteria bacterium]
GNIQIEIWERGAGYTLASGSSSTAAAAVAYKLGLCGPNIIVHMPGGNLEISFRDGFLATMTGPVTKVCEGVMTHEMFVKKMNFQSGSRGFFSPGPHTTWHAGPHQAVHEAYRAVAG